MDREKPDAGKASRRDFLKLAATGAPVTAVATATGAGTALADEADAGEGLRPTEAAKKYYETARF